jgi:hypothetical protein
VAIFEFRLRAETTSAALCEKLCGPLRLKFYRGGCKDWRKVPQSFASVLFGTLPEAILRFTLFISPGLPDYVCSYNVLGDAIIISQFEWIEIDK